MNFTVLTTCSILQVQLYPHNINYIYDQEFIVSHSDKYYLATIQIMNIAPAVYVFLFYEKILPSYKHVGLGNKVSLLVRVGQLTWRTLFFVQGGRS
jgi:hypothetical protein